MIGIQSLRSAAIVIGALWLVPTPGAGSEDRDHLIFRAETLDGVEVASTRPDLPFNPASVVKVGTSLWALDRLGPDFRWETPVGYLGELDRNSGAVRGALVIGGRGDPDFHLENAFLVARSLNGLGLRRVDGDLVVTGSFFMGWENGIERDDGSSGERAAVMGTRLLNALDVSRWTTRHRQAWQELCARRGWDPATPPSVSFTGGVRHVADPGHVRPLVIHRSNPLSVVLRRFNVYSNNDIIRISDGLGGAAALAEYLRTRLAADPHELELSTASGQNRNRMTARVAVRLMREFQSELERHDLRLDDVLPIPGCDPGPTRRMFPILANNPLGPLAVVKTGTLTTTDGGVVVLAGAFSNDLGTVLFCVAATGTGREITRWRRAEETWLLDLMKTLAGAEPRPCGPELPFSSSDAAVVETGVRPAVVD